MVEFHVLRCAFCNIFQVQQVTKTSKWKCKLCGEKQSIIKVYGQGTGADCRKHVQKLNTLQGQIDQEAQESSLLSVLSGMPHLKSSNNDSLIVENLTSSKKNSHWSQFLDVHEDADSEATDADLFATTDLTEFQKNRKRKRPESMTKTFTRFTKNSTNYNKQTFSGASFGKQFNQANKQFTSDVFEEGCKLSVYHTPDIYEHTRDNMSNYSVDGLKESTESIIQQFSAGHSVRPDVQGLTYPFSAVQNISSAACITDCPTKKNYSNTEPYKAVSQTAGSVKPKTFEKNQGSASLKWSSFLDNSSGSDEDDDDSGNVHCENVSSPVYVTSLSRPELKNYLADEI